MPFIIADRVRETSTTVGTGSIALGGAVTGFQTFDSVLDTADTTYYTIADQSGPNWEVGIGTFTAPSTLARTTILSSSNGGSIVNFGAGTKDVFISLPAGRTVQSVSAGTTGLTPSTSSFGAVTLGGTLAVTNGGTGATTAPNALTNLGAVAKAGDTMTGVLGVVAGTVSAPGLTFSGDTNTGIYSPAADTIAIVEGGVEALRINSSGQSEFTAGTAALPSITATGDTNTGIYFPAADTVAIVEGGVEALRINSSAQAGFTAGTPSLPSITTTGDTDTGIYFPAADTVAITTNGAEDFRIGPAGQIGLQGANYGTSGQVLTSNGASAAPSWQTISGGVTSFNTRTGAVTLSSGDVTGALGYTPMNSTNTTFSALTVSSTAPTIGMADTDNIIRYVHTNGNLIGFLSSGGGWTMYNDNSGSIWTPVYGWLQDFFFHAVSVCTNWGNCGGTTGNCNPNPIGGGGQLWITSNCGNAQQDRVVIRDDGSTVWMGMQVARFNCNCACNC